MSTGTSQRCSNLPVFTTTGVTFRRGSSVFESTQVMKAATSSMRLTSVHPIAAISADSLCGVLIIDQRMTAACLAWKRAREAPGTRRDTGAREPRVCIIIRWSYCNIGNPPSQRLRQAVSDKSVPAREAYIWHQVTVNACAT